MRHDEPQKNVSLFDGLDVPVEIVDAQEQFFDALKGLVDPGKRGKLLLRHFTEMFLLGLLKRVVRDICCRAQIIRT